MTRQNVIYSMFAVLVLAATYITATQAANALEYYYTLVYWHLATILPAFAVGTYLMLSRKGTPFHRVLGRFYMVSMLLTAVISLMMPAQIGPTVLGHFGLIHLFSLLAIQSVLEAWFAIRKGDIKRHAKAMMGLYLGGLILAGGFTFMPGRMLHGWLLSVIG